MRNHRRGRGGARLGLLAVALVALSVVPSGGASGSCAGPELSAPALVDRPPQLMIGGETTVTGTSFVDGCDDGGGADVLGCSRDEGETVTPLRDVTLILRQQGRTWELGTADAGTAQEGRLGQVSWTIRVPMDLAAGPAVLVAGRARLKVEVGGRLHVDRPPDAAPR